MDEEDERTDGDGRDARVDDDDEWPANLEDYGADSYASYGVYQLVKLVATKMLKAPRGRS